MTIQMIYELNHTYMAVSGDEIENTEDYRYRMLASNDIKEVLPLEIRTINNERKIYIDVSGKETLLNYLSARPATRGEIKKLFESVFVISEHMRRYLINEIDVSMRPEMIFRDTKTGEYEFVCIPLKETDGKNEGMNTLMQFLMMHLDNSDEKLVNAVYSINDMYLSSNPKFSLAYDLFFENIKEEVDEEEHLEIKEEPLIIKEKRKIKYIPSVKEIGVAALGIVGLAFLGYSLYLSMIAV